MEPFLPIKGAFTRNSSAVTALFTTHKRTLLLSISFLLLISIQSYGQGETWTLLKEESGVKVYYQIAPCDEPIDTSVVPAPNPADKHQHLKLKIENSNTSSIGMEWDQDIKTTGNDGLIDITVSPGTTIIDQNSMVPYLQLTKEDNDDYPKSFLEYLDLLKITIKP